MNIKTKFRFYLGPSGTKTTLKKKALQMILGPVTSVWNLYLELQSVFRRLSPSFLEETRKSYVIPSCPSLPMLSL